MTFILPPEMPTQEGGKGVLYDFNDGARVLLPKGEWHVNIIDEESGNILFSCDTQAGWVSSTKKYYVKFRIQVFKKGEATPFLDEIMELKNKHVLISYPTGTLGDILAWFHSAENFRMKHQCQLECSIGEEFITLFSDEYPEIKFTPAQEKTESKPYATYRIGLFFNGDTDNQPVDFRLIGFHRNAGYILGLPPQDEPPRLNLTAERKIKEPYVCIAVQSTAQAKHWNNGLGWDEVVKYLKELGYRVLCIDRNAHSGHGFVWNHIPWGAEDFTGSVPLQERVDLLKHASFFVGLSSGLSWLAWAVRVPVVLISGFTLPNSEFYTPWRVFNSHGCNGCWDKTNYDFNHTDFLWCPEYKGTERQFECTRLITGKQVCGVIDSLHSYLADCEKVMK
ncbi:autotransporter strand-loop-strand O-heptosyltransferase [Escherichia coli]|uniref:autotransporter strand-loop-strand O-heptosyltransferase n=1 Tax=Escherichia coli TaxID=562 RepID=UPI0015EE563C|nr:autotransporter strand-loop-strand O-heptosyltransferase [Escherichia coli]EHC5800490.1 autotransporter strand-loop-strand O-heptosyltransferase [Escherichia coli]